MWRHFIFALFTKSIQMSKSTTPMTIEISSFCQLSAGSFWIVIGKLTKGLNRHPVRLINFHSPLALTPTKIKNKFLSTLFSFLALKGTAYGLYAFVRQKFTTSVKGSFNLVNVSLCQNKSKRNPPSNCRSRKKFAGFYKPQHRSFLCSLLKHVEFLTNNLRLICGCVKSVSL